MQAQLGFITDVLPGAFKGSSPTPEHYDLGGGVLVLFQDSTDPLQVIYYEHIVGLPLNIPASTPMPKSIPGQIHYALKELIDRFFSPFLIVSVVLKGRYKARKTY